MDQHDKQLTLESEMSALGLIRYRARQQQATERSQLWATDAARDYTARLLITIAERIEARIDMMESKPGRLPVALEYIKFLHPKANALLTMRSTLNSVMRMRSVTRASVMIGGEIERESRYHLFRAAYPGLFETIKRRIKNSTSPGYKHKVISQAMGTSEFKYEKWTEELRLRVGAILLDILLKLGVVERKPSLIHHRARKGPILVASTNLKEWLSAYDDYYELLSPMYLPCIVAPRDWSGPMTGGYHSDILEDLPLVKGTTKRYINKLSEYDMPLVYKGINALQAVPWSVYVPILGIVEEHWHLGREIGTLPSSDDIPLPHKPVEISSDRVARVAWKRKAAAVWETNIRSRSKRIAAMQIITTARRYGTERFYYPHQLDFRSRVYTVPHPLTVQGSDLCRGVLQFDEALPVKDDSGVAWLAIHGANTFGYDKATYDDRIKWVEDHAYNIELCAQDPYQHKWWTEADDPWQFLRWTHDWVGLQTDGYEYESKLPVSVDQTCSGLQHYAALLRDPISGASTNLGSSDSPRDIYSDVASAVTKKIERSVASDQMARLWISYGVERSTIKRIVMTTPYGSKKYSHRTFIVDDINKRGDHPFEDKTPEAAQWLANVVWETIGEVIVAARLGMDWLREAAKIVVKGGKSLKWVTPIGFPVEQLYESMMSKQIRLSLGDGSSCKSTLRVPANNTPDKIRQVNGIAPNVIHSLDATVLIIAVVKAKEIGLNNIGVVHDSFSTHACNVDALGTVVREAFVEVYKEPVLDNLRQQFQDLADEPLPSTPPMGSLDINEVIESPYFAG